MKDLRERYFHSGSPLELPAESRIRLKLSRSSHFNMEHLSELQNAMISRLRDYWYFAYHEHFRLYLYWLFHRFPRFLVHCLKEGILLPKVPKTFRSGSATPHAMSHSESEYREAMASVTPTHTPTYKRLAGLRPNSSIANRKIGRNGMHIGM